MKKIEEKLMEWLENVNSGGKDKQIKYYDGKYWRTKTLKKDDEMAINRVIEKLNLFINKNKNILGDNDGMFNLKSDKINVLPLQKIENEEAITIVGEFLKRVLKERIKAAQDEEVEIKVFEKPTLVIIEEAHIFAVKSLKDRSGYWISKIAKEGRKFGVGLGLVSQRPKELNPTTLSQMNTKIILRIIEPTDQRYILESSENIGEDLPLDLPQLSTGEAVIVDSSLPLPALVKIKKYDGVLGREDGFEILNDL
ncbi:ATP-binding protein [Methanocaldococcus sp.]|uniref:ATP-binding protein n=1 Tax=Methanocaldococcus sp. TaxID=2152917 RepID=UPI0026055B81|nr:ATP-binding protein [Methanocaldococcus sp.]MCQ6253849.1 ATP-binding protein [Methanocaldococcus sp.]